MFSPRKALPAPTAQDFGFPYTPYEIQAQLMQELFLVLERKQIGIFESPTGTGKSLTLTCGALTWLQQHEQLVRAELMQRIEQVQAELELLERESAQATDWITAQSETQSQRQELQQLQRLRSLLQEKEQQLQQMRERRKTQRRAARKAQQLLTEHIAEEATPELDSDDDDDDEEQQAQTELEQQQPERFRDVQIFYCSRTHSQLTQIVSELRKTPHGKNVRCVCLGSRQQLCVNAQVRRLNSVALMNERCLDMARAKAAPAQPNKKPRLAATALKLSRCSFKSSVPLQQLQDALLCEPLDIEELAQEGASCGGCAYYASRQAQPQAQLVLLPYALLLQRSAREQLGLQLSGAVIIIDEAHNLLDTIAQLHSAELNVEQLQLAREQLSGYKQRYVQRLSSANLLRLNQLLFVVRRLLQLLESSQASRLLRTYELTAEGDFFNIDLVALLQFCERTRFAQKLQGYAKQLQSEPQPSENRAPPLTLLQRLATQHQQRLEHTKKRKLETEQQAAPPPAVRQPLLPSPLRPLLAFLSTLTSAAADGRVLLQPAAGSFKYLLLNPAEHFADILSQARALIIAGGTMQPTQELTAQLFQACPERIVQRFYSHVVPADAVLPFVVPTGPTGASLCFNYAQRATPAMLQELSMLLQNLCNVLPAGVVCFLPSYGYLDTVYAQLERSGVLARIAQRKRIFRESAGQAVEQLLQQYADAIQDSSGALLLSVVGGKLSEGLNFADNLGRGVIVVGLPYPNRNSPELQERMRHLDATLAAGAGSEYYENLCMKAVNQCIGRSVRHIRDYACVYLLDERYASAKIQQKLPAWIAHQLVVASGGFGNVQASTVRFFKSKQT
ncbi:CG11403 [Drosophila busckii]|uniref:DNA 5'-3' helicase n=1 Tax=Drosophila busckii TaxID=30019 RepID=A0A0M4ESV2_DROBS|nr:ATP-dependent DNA helicase DDX11 [Drosophila busckii]ALC48501.1 CG11403 [Drosophila busckii]